MKKLEVRLEDYCRALAPEDAANVESLVRFLNTYADGILQDEFSLMSGKGRPYVILPDIASNLTIHKN